MLPKADRASDTELLSAWDIGPHSLERLGATQNHAYRVDAADGRRYLLRIHVSHRLSAEIDAELAWLELLTAFGEVAVPGPVRPRGGGWTADTEENGVRRSMSLLRWIDGTMLSALPPTADVQPFARALAALHRRGSDPDAAGLGRSRRAYDMDYVRRRLAVLERSCPEELARGSTRQDLSNGASALEAALRESGDAIMVHGDYHPGNLILGNGRAAVIDFDRCGLGPAAMDVASAILYLLPRQRIRFHEAYADAGGPARVEKATFGTFLFLAYLDNVAHLSKVAGERATMAGNVAQLAAFARAL
ncbi:phosphotransferase enzyme family protein [Planctomonas psychrotolerans]|uniref:phosphotransferase enzyme family protein n=1 Tax=Planctomonas psychrotolerans TaxID=2528712 RepID=UPI001D0D70AB|nr:aminoglycoside phosphotransferase family protein [Planctomonas psychrotolerans]